MEEWYRKLDVIRAVNVGAISAAALYGRTDSGIATFKEILKAVENLQSADLEAAIVKVLKMVEEYKEKTGLDEILIMPKNGMKAWDENGVEYTMQPEQRWIPRSIKQPYKKGLMLVTYKDGDIDLLMQPTAYRKGDIVAWMPLPEPYRGDEQE